MSRAREQLVRLAKELGYAGIARRLSGRFDSPVHHTTVRGWALGTRRPELAFAFAMEDELKIPARAWTMEAAPPLNLRSAKTLEGKLQQLARLREEYERTPEPEGPKSVLILNTDGTTSQVQTGDTAIARTESFATFVARALKISERQAFRLLRAERGCDPELVAKGASLRKAVRAAGLSAEGQSALMESRTPSRNEWRAFLIQRLNGCAELSVWPSGASVPGAADISGVIDGGTLLEIQTRLPGEVQGGEQRKRERQIKAYRGIYVVATFDPGVDLTVNVERVRQAILTEKAEK